MVENRPPPSILTGIAAAICPLEIVTHASGAFIFLIGDCRRRNRLFPWADFEIPILRTPSPAFLWVVSSARLLKQEHLAGKNALRIAAIEAGPSIAVIPPPDAPPCLLRKVSEPGVPTEYWHRTKLCMFRLP